MSEETFGYKLALKWLPHPNPLPLGAWDGLALEIDKEIDRLKSELSAERERAGRMREAVKDYLESYGCIGNDFNLERMRKELHEEALRQSCGKSSDSR